MSKDYTPVSCATHSEYELYIMHRQQLRLVHDDHGNVVTEVVTPTDIITRDHAEYLVLETSSGECKTIRLDRIIEAHCLG